MLSSETIHLRNHGSNGNLKDWKCEILQDGIILSWGPTGRTLQSKFIKTASPQAEAHKRSEKKKREGYWHVPTSDSEDPAQELASVTEDDISQFISQKQEIITLFREDYESDEEDWVF